MARSKKPRKKHNYNEKKIKASDRLAKNSMFLCVPYLGDKGNLIIHNNKLVAKGSVEPMHFHLIYGVSRPWSFIIGTYNRSPDGKTYLSYDLMDTTNRIALKDHNEWLIEMMKEQCQKVNKEHILSPFFFAFPNHGEEMSDGDMIKLLEGLAIEKMLITHWEEDNLREKAHQEVSELPITGDKQTWAILRKNGISNWLDVRLGGFERLKSLKGIGEKRMEKLLDEFTQLIEQYRDNLANYFKLEFHSAQQNEVLEHLEMTNKWGLTH